MGLSFLGSNLALSGAGNPAHVMVNAHTECRYRAVVTGKLEPGAGVVDALVDGKEARTKYSVVRHEFRDNFAAWVTLVDLWPLSGRKHQLRVHMAALGHPIVGEPMYQNGAAVPKERLFDGWFCKGMYLCAVELTLRHPQTGERLNFEVQEPEKFGALIGRKPKQRRRATEGGVMTGEGADAGVEDAIHGNGGHIKRGEAVDGWTADTVLGGV
jgi:hypothetical protein